MWPWKHSSQPTAEVALHRPPATARAPLLILHCALGLQETEEASADPRKVQQPQGDVATGFYKLCRDVQKNGRPVWRHVSYIDRWLAFSGSAWNVQSEACLGEKRAWLSLRADQTPTTPDLSEAQWEASAGSGHGWQPRPSLELGDSSPCASPASGASRAAA